MVGPSTTRAAGIRVRGLSVGFPGSPALVLDGVDLDVAAGRALAVMGPSGVGKTTLGLALAGVLDAARVRVTGSIEPASRGSIIYLPQDPREAFCPFIPVTRQIVDVIPEGTPDPEARARAALEASGLDPARAERLPATLSTGEAQRALLAAARASGAAGIVLDEPLARLDAPLRTRLAPEIGALARSEGRAVILLTHDLYLAAAAADEVVHLDGPRLLAGPPPGWRTKT